MEKSVQAGREVFPLQVKAASKSSRDGTALDLDRTSSLANNPGSDAVTATTSTNTNTNSSSSTNRPSLDQTDTPSRDVKSARQGRSSRFTASGIAASTAGASGRPNAQSLKRPRPPAQLLLNEQELKRHNAFYDAASPSSDPHTSDADHSSAHSEDDGDELSPSSRTAQTRSTKPFREPQARSITQEQLVAEVKGIYAGLVMIEHKCIEVDGTQADIQAKALHPSEIRLDGDQYKALIALHKTLLNEHYDFLLASQYPSANETLKGLAAKYAIPARMWRHGIHTFLELLRHRLPDSRDYMLAFIYIAYSMMALLYETVQSFEDTWIECLGDLARYRMAIESEDNREREAWTVMARFWYTKAADRSPSTGRLYHHLAILARPNHLQQLSFYCKSLVASNPFAAARESILTQFKPALDSRPQAFKPQRSELTFIAIHARLFMQRQIEDIPDEIEKFLVNQDVSIGASGDRGRENGVYIAIANQSALFSYGSDNSELSHRIEEGRHNQEKKAKFDTGEDRNSARVCFEQAVRLTFETFKIYLLRIGDDNTLPHIHVNLILLLYLHRCLGALDVIKHALPIEALVSRVNSMIKLKEHGHRIREMQQKDFPEYHERGRPLTDDFRVRSLPIAEDYFPSHWFDIALADDDDERTLEKPSMAEGRIRRILWITYILSQNTQLFFFNQNTRTFHTHRVKMDTVMSDQDFPASGPVPDTEPIAAQMASHHMLHFILAHDVVLAWPQSLSRLVEESQFDYIIPVRVWSNLYSLADESSATAHARLAIGKINAAIDSERSLRILDPQCHDHTQQQNWSSESVSSSALNTDIITLAMKLSRPTAHQKPADPPMKMGDRKSEENMHVIVNDSPEEVAHNDNKLSMHGITNDPPTKGFERGTQMSLDVVTSDSLKKLVANGSGSNVHIITNDSDLQQAALFHGLQASSLGSYLERLYPAQSALVPSSPFVSLQTS